MSGAFCGSIYGICLESHQQQEDGCSRTEGRLPHLLKNMLDMEYLHQIIELVSWPAFIFICYRLIVIALIRFETKHPELHKQENKE
jgi:hypothetical protein